MNDKILVRDDIDGLTPTRTHDWFRDHGYYWAVTETIDGFPSYVVTHVSTGMAVPFSRDESPEAAKEAYFEGIVEYDQETIDDLVSDFDEIPNHRVCPHCDGEGFVDESPEQTGERVRELEEENERLREIRDQTYEEIDRRLSVLKRQRNEMRSKVQQMRDAIRRVRSYNADIRDGKINYHPQDHIDVLDNALDGGGDDYATG